MSGHVLVSASEMCGKVRAAVDARRNRELVIIARTDAIASAGLDDAILRGNRYRDAGADAIMVMAPHSLDDLKRYRDGVQGPLVTTVGSWRFRITVEDLSAIGYQVALYPLTTLRRTVVAVGQVLADLKMNGFVDHDVADFTNMHDLHTVLGLDAVLAAERRYAGD